MVLWDIEKELLKALEIKFMVRKERLELSRLATLEPKSSVSTNSTTPAKNSELYPNKLNISLLRNRFHFFNCHTNSAFHEASQLHQQSLGLVH